MKRGTKQSLRSSRYLHVIESGVGLRLTRDDCAYRVVGVKVLSDTRAFHADNALPEDGTTACVSRRMRRGGFVVCTRFPAKRDDATRASRDVVVTRVREALNAGEGLAA